MRRLLTALVLLVLGCAVPARAAIFMATIQGTLMTVSGTPSDGSISVGQVVTGNAVATGTTVTGLGTGVGGAGTYTVLPGQVVRLQAMTTSGPPSPIPPPAPAQFLYPDGSNRLAPSSYLNLVPSSYTNIFPAKAYGNCANTWDGNAGHDVGACMQAAIKRGGGGWNGDTNAITGIRVIFPSQNITAGSCALQRLS